MKTQQAVAAEWVNDLYIASSPVSPVRIPVSYTHLTLPTTPYV